MKNHPYTFDTYDQMAKYFGQYNFGVEIDGKYKAPYLDALFTNHSDMSINYMITQGWRKSPASETLVDAKGGVGKIRILNNSLNADQYEKIYIIPCNISRSRVVV